MKNFDEGINNWHHHRSRGTVGDPHGHEGRGGHEPEEDHVRRRAQEEDDSQRDSLKDSELNNHATFHQRSNMIMLKSILTTF